MLDRVRNLGKGLGVPLQPSTEEPRWALEDDEAPPPPMGHGPWICRCAYDRWRVLL